MDLKIAECLDLPELPERGVVYRLLPKSPDDSFYWNRVDRNLGWITPGEQVLLSQSKVGIAGCGGMGGMLAQIFSRLGIGEIRIADPEVFDASNINRQFAARMDTVGKSKAFETARATRQILDDGMLVVYPQGICEEAADSFLAGCDLVCDEIEFWAVGARILLHQRARGANVPVFTCNTVGFGTRLFLFEPQGFTIEELLGWTYDEAVKLEQLVREKRADPEEITTIIERKFRLVPELPEYMVGEQHSDRETVYRRLVEEGRASIVATNPPMAAGFLADRVLLYLLRDSGVKRNIITPPPMPGYLYFDAARMESKVVTERWW